MTSHRAQGPARGMRARLAGIVVAVIVVIVAVWLVVAGFPGGSSKGSTDHGAPATPTPSASSTPASPATSATATPTTRPKRTLPAVKAATPRRLTVSGLVDASFGEALTGPTGSHYIVQDPSRLLRDASRGLPGSPGTGTTVVVGAATSRGDGALQRLDQITKGTAITLQTETGTLTYRVTAVDKHDPDAVPGLPAITHQDREALVVVVAHYEHGNRLGQDTVVRATLTGAQPG